MGRYTSDTGGGQPRKKTIKLFASDPAVAVPAWAGVVYVTGCGGGGGGGAWPDTTARGDGGGAGGFCVRLPVMISPGVTTIAVTVGAGGEGAPAAATFGEAAGASGGNTQIVIGGIKIQLGGGKGGLTNQFLTHGGLVSLGEVALVPAAVVAGQTVPVIEHVGLSGHASPLSSGATGGDGVSSSAGYGAGGVSPFGAGGARVGSLSAHAVAPASKHATGWGAGGSGENGTSSAGDGSPGFVVLEFEETA